MSLFIKQVKSECLTDTRKGNKPGLALLITGADQPNRATVHDTPDQSSRITPSAKLLIARRLRSR